MDKGMKQNMTKKPLLSIEKLHCPRCDKTHSALGRKSGLASIRSSIKCCRCLLTHPSKEWLCECGVRWPKCEIHRPKPKAKISLKTNEKIIRRKALERKFGTCKPLPQRQTDDHYKSTKPTATTRQRPRQTDGADDNDGYPPEPTITWRKRCHENIGEDYPVSRAKITTPEKFHDSDREHVGERIESVSSNWFVSQNAHGTQLDIIQSDTKFNESSFGAASSHDPLGLVNCEPPVEATSVSNKRKIDDTNFQSTDPATQRRGKVNLNPGSELALRFPNM